MWEITKDGRPLLWRTWDEDITPTYLYPEPGRNGGYSLGIEISGNVVIDTRFSANWYQKVPVEEKQPYILGGWLKTDNIAGKDGVRIVASWLDSDDNWIGNSDIMQPVKGTHNWQYYEGEVIVPAGAKYCTVSCQIVSSTGRTWFDDMLFMKKTIH